MPNTGEVQRKGFKQEIFTKKLRDFEQRTTQSMKHNACQAPSCLKAELVFSRYRPMNQTMMQHQESLFFPKLQRGGQKRKLTTTAGAMFQPLETPFRPQNRHSEGGAPHTIRRNKVAPFSTLGKPTCGFNFSRDTDNRKKNFGIMPSNLVKWRSNKLEKETINC